MESAGQVEAARENARVAGEALKDLADYLGSLPDDAWSGPSGCADWTIRDLANHAVGEAVWLPNLLRGISGGEAPLPDEVYERQRSMPAADLVSDLTRATTEMPAAVATLMPEHLEVDRDIGFGPISVLAITQVGATEATFHGWDAFACRVEDPHIETRRAAYIAKFAHEWVWLLSHQGDLTATEGRYLMQVGDGIGPVALEVAGGQVAAERRDELERDVTIHLTPDQYIRLLWGRLDLAGGIDAGAVRVEGDRERALNLTRIFAGL